MQTHIGRVVVSTIEFRRKGWLVWETAVITYDPDPDGHWCHSQYAFELLDRYLSEWEAFIGHAFIVGWLRVGLELEASTHHQPLRLVPVGAPFRGLIALALQPRCIGCPMGAAAPLPALGTTPPMEKNRTA